MTKQFKKFLLIKPGTKVKLEKCNPVYVASKKEKEGHKEEGKTELSDYADRMSQLQYKLFANKTMSLLIILQGVDTSGKDWTVRHLMGALNPQSCGVESFKEPTTEELSHDFLW